MKHVEERRRAKVKATFRDVIGENIAAPVNYARRLALYNNLDRITAFLLKYSTTRLRYRSKVSGRLPIFL